MSLKLLNDTSNFYFVGHTCTDYSVKQNSCFNVKSVEYVISEGHENDQNHRKYDSRKLFYILIIPRKKMKHENVRV